MLQVALTAAWVTASHRLVPIIERQTGISRDEFCEAPTANGAQVFDRSGRLNTANISM